MADSDSQIPWFSGLCLEGEVAAQYRIEGREGQEGDGAPTYLELDNLAPITIFVGANNSGKSRLLREIFANLKPVYLRLGGPQEVEREEKALSSEFDDLITEAMRWHAIRLAGIENLKALGYGCREGWLPSSTFNDLRQISLAIEKIFSPGNGDLTVTLLEYMTSAKHGLPGIEALLVKSLVHLSSVN